MNQLQYNHIYDYQYTMALAKLMTNLMPQYYDFLKKEAKRRGKTMREILEEAIRLYKREKKKEEIRKGYDGMENDKEYLEEMRAMAEMGMEYYLKDLEKAEKHYEDTEI